MRRSDKQRNRNAPDAGRRADALHHILSRLPRQHPHHRPRRLPKPSSPTPKLLLHPSHPRPRRCLARRRRLPVPRSRCATGRLTHHMTRVRVRGQTQPTHTVHRRVHRPFLGPISLSQPRYPLFPRACSSPRLRVSRTGAGSPSNRMHQQPSSALSRNSRLRTGHSLLLGRTKHHNHSRHVAISPIENSFSLSRV